MPKLVWLSRLWLVLYLADLHDLALSVFILCVVSFPDMQCHDQKCTAFSYMFELKFNENCSCLVPRPCKKSMSKIFHMILTIELRIHSQFPPQFFLFVCLFVCLFFVLFCFFCFFYCILYVQEWDKSSGRSLERRLS